MQIGEKIRRKRTLLMLTQEELANRCELTKGYISQLENDKVSPSIETLEHILEVLSISLSDFFKEEDKEEILVYNWDLQNDKQFDGYLQTWLVPTVQERQMEPILVEIQPGVSTFSDYPHPGEEFGYVIEGSVMVVYGATHKECKKGESFYFPANKEHYLKNIGKKKAVVIWVSTPPNF